MIHILIAGTQAMIRGALTQVISAQRDMAVTAEFLLERGVSLEATKYSPAHLLLLDATTPTTESIGMIDCAQSAEAGKRVAVEFVSAGHKLRALAG